MSDGLRVDVLQRKSKMPRELVRYMQRLYSGELVKA